MSITVRRYQQQQRRNRAAHPGRGKQDRPVTIKGTHMGDINMNTYVVDPDAVADAIVRRLLAGNRKSA